MNLSNPDLIPIKVMGDANQLKYEMIETLILQHLGPQSHETNRYESNCKGQYISHTFWVRINNPEQETLLRKAITKLPGYKIQL